MKKLITFLTTVTMLVCLTSSFGIKANDDISGNIEVGQPFVAYTYNGLENMYNELDFNDYVQINQFLTALRATNNAMRENGQIDFEASSLVEKHLDSMTEINVTKELVIKIWDEFTNAYLVKSIGSPIYRDSITGNLITPDGVLPDDEFIIADITGNTDSTSTVTSKDAGTGSAIKVEDHSITGTTPITVSGTVITVSGTIVGTVPEEGFVIASDIDPEDISGHTETETTPWLTTEIETTDDTVVSTEVTDTSENISTTDDTETIDVVGPPISYDEWLKTPQLVSGKKNSFTIRPFNQLTVKVNTKKKVKWSSKNKNIATVNKKTGVITAKNIGTTTIVGKYGKKKVKVQITVVPYTSVNTEYILMNTKDIAYIDINVFDLPNDINIIQPEKINLMIEVTGESQLKLTPYIEGVFEVPIMIYSKNKGLVTEHTVKVLVSDNITKDKIIFDDLKAIGTERFIFEMGNITFTVKDFDIAQKFSTLTEAVPYNVKGSDVEFYRYELDRSIVTDEVLATILPYVTIQSELSE